MDGNISVNAKQVIVMRKDLNMRKGKMVSQGSHASMGAFLTMFTKTKIADKCKMTYLAYLDETCSSNTIRDKVLLTWLDGSFTKICLYVDNEEELINIYEKIKKESPSIPIVMIEDNGLTEFHGIQTKTCIGIGPWVSEEIDKFTGHLKLL